MTQTQQPTQCMIDAAQERSRAEGICVQYASAVLRRAVTCSIEPDAFGSVGDGLKLTLEWLDGGRRQQKTELLEPHCLRAFGLTHVALRSAWRMLESLFIKGEIMSPTEVQGPKSKVQSRPQRRQPVYRPLFVLLLLLSPLSILLSAAPAAAQGANTDEVLRRGNRVTHAGGHQQLPIGALPIAGGEDGPLSPLGESVPPSDAGKWFCTVYTTKGCQPCAQLMADWRVTPALLAIGNPADKSTSWTHFNLYDSTSTQKFRFGQASPPIPVDVYPTIIVQPPRDGSFGSPKITVFRETGYNGDAAGLASRMADAIRTFASKVRPTVPDQQPLVTPGPVVPNQNPFQPPVAPSFPPLQIPPLPSTSPANVANASIPDYAEAVVITDPEAVGESDAEDLANEALSKMQANHPGARLKARALTWGNSAAAYGVSRDQLPAMVMTQNKRVVGTLTHDMLRAIAGRHTPPAPSLAPTTTAPTTAPPATVAPTTPAATATPNLSQSPTASMSPAVLTLIQTAVQQILAQHGIAPLTAPAVAPAVVAPPKSASQANAANPNAANTAQIATPAEAHPVAAEIVKVAETALAAVSQPAAAASVGSPASTSAPATAQTTHPILTDLETAIASISWTQLPWSQLALPGGIATFFGALAMAALARLVPAVGSTVVPTSTGSAPAAVPFAEQAMEELLPQAVQMFETLITKNATANSQVAALAAKAAQIAVPPAASVSA